MKIDYIQNHHYCRYNRYNDYGLRRNRKSNELSKSLFQLLLITALMILTGLAFVSGIDKHIQNQDRMLCESAKVSGNPEYLSKCECYYEGEDISCLEGGDTE
jgi:hypothetical protein